MEPTFRAGAALTGEIARSKARAAARITDILNNSDSNLLAMNTDKTIAPSLYEIDSQEGPASGQANLAGKSTPSPSNIFQKLHQLSVEDARNVSHWIEDPAC